MRAVGAEDDHELLTETRVGGEQRVDAVFVHRREVCEVEQDRLCLGGIDAFALLAQLGSGDGVELPGDDEMQPALVASAFDRERAGAQAARGVRLDRPVERAVG